MKKIAIALGALVVLLAAAAAAAPWYLGMRTENELRARLKDSNGSGSPLRLTLVQYQRGWLSSTALHRVSLKSDADVYFDVRHEIEHVPTPGGSLVRIRSTPRWPEPVQAAADYYFGKQPALTVTTVVDFDRNVAIRLQSPSFSKPLLTQPAVKLSWGGAAGSLTFAGESRMKLDVSMPRIAFEGGGAIADLKGASLRGDWIMAGSQVDWQGQTRIAVSDVSFNGPGGGGSLKEFETVMSQRNKGQTIMLGYSLKVKEGVATGAGAQPEGFSDAELEIEFDRLDKRALSKYFEDVAGAEQAGVSDSTRMRLVAQLWLGLVNELLKGSPEVRIKKIGVKTASGALNGSAVLSFNGEGLAEIASPAELLARAKFSGSAQVSSTLLRAWMVKDARARATNALVQNGAMPDEAQVQMLSEQLVQQQLAALEAAGLLKAEGENFALRAEMVEGSLTLNGTPANELLGPMLMVPFAPQPAEPAEEQHA
jgi:uncharacterized protein YdgA (DUF945 family)